MDSSVRTSELFVAGGTLPHDTSCYVSRPADDELYNAVLAGHFSYVFAAHHMGKSSLMVRTAWRLGRQGVNTTTVDLAGYGSGVRIDEPYLYLIKRLKLQLGLAVDPDTWWAERASSNVTQRFIDFLHEVVLTQVAGPVVIFVDEIDSSLDSRLIDSLLAAIRFTYSARDSDPAYNRLNFVLLGPATVNHLTRGQNQSLFAAGRKIDLREFNREQAEVLAQTLQAACPGSGDDIFSRILYWTNGHPYLTQRLCQAVAKRWDGHGTGQWVDELVERVFVASEASEEPNLQFVESRIRASRPRRRILNCYRRVYEGQEVPVDEGSLDQSRLKLVGLVRAQHGSLKVHNEVYRRVFDLHWIEASMPVNWTGGITVVAILLVVLSVCIVGFSVQQQRQRRTQAEALIDSFRGTTSTEERLANLAGLFSLRGQKDEARRVFFEELSPAEQLALFNPADPRAVGEQLVTVVKAVYSDPNLDNNQQGNDLLVAMAEPLPQLENVPSLGAIALELEIRQWLKGREYYKSQGPYQRAVDAYNTAISINGRNPGTYFDRGLAYAALGDLSQALDDFSTVLNMDQRWQARVSGAVLRDPQLYTKLWDEHKEYRPLIALVPTPTGTPTSTATPQPTSTPTDTPVPPTSTPTPESTATPTVTSTATPAPSPTPNASSESTIVPNLTPGALTGAFTLLNPLSLEDPSHGPTDFEWEWTGDVPPGSGFEVRVWREGQPPLGAHDAVLDNQNGNIKNVNRDTYRLRTNIRESAGVQGQSGIYFWTVALVQISPAYADLGQQAEPALLRFEAGSPGDDGGDSGSSDGGVGID